MAISEAKFKQLKRRAEVARTARDQSKGALETTKARLAEEFDCDTVAEATVLAEALKEDAAKAEAAYDKAVDVFEEAWSEHLED